MNALLHLLLTNLIPLLWLAWLMYWWFGAGQLKAVERHESSVQRASHAIPMVVAALLFLLPARSLGMLAAPFSARSGIGYGIGLILVMLGLGFAVQARRHLGANWSAMVTLKHEHSQSSGIGLPSNKRSDAPMGAPPD